MDAPQLAAVAADLDDYSRGLRAVAALRRLVEALELAHVTRALESGESWSAIAADLGVSRQNVHRKYMRRLRDTAPTIREKDQ